MKYHDIAVIGLACRIGNASDKDEFWKGLREGKDFIRKIPENRKKLFRDYYKALGKSVDNESFYEVSFIDDIDKFDYEYFGISKFEAGLMSPQQRLFIETTCAAIEDAGYSLKGMNGSKTGVFVGNTTDFNISYRQFIGTVDRSLLNTSISGNLNSIIAGRISYFLNLHGPAILFDSACSSSLTAIIEACDALRQGRCDMALAGAVRLEFLPSQELSRTEEIGINSSTGRTRTFDDNSDGTGFGEGVGTIMLKPLEKAIDDSDHIYAVIKGYSMNQDGTSMGLTAPNPIAQTEVITQAWKDAKIDPSTVSYIECHGTGTKLGDPIEVEGIKKAFVPYTSHNQFCGVGSVKTNVGHLDNAAGIAGIVKLILSLSHSELPPTINFSYPNQMIDFENSPVYINNTLRKWENKPKRCGISAFGLSGTNCHIVLEEAPEVIDKGIEKSEDSKIIMLSAKSMSALVELAGNYFDYIYNNKSVNLNQICFVANTGRDHYSYRLAVIFKNSQELLSHLEKFVALNNSYKNENFFYGCHEMVPSNQTFSGRDEITQQEKSLLTSQLSDLLHKYNRYTDDIKSRICEYYVGGADMDFSEYYKTDKWNKIPLPSYPFAKTSCWVHPDEKKDRPQTYRMANEDSYPLLSYKISESYDRITWVSIFSDKLWVLSEHLVKGKNVVPGTTYIEMMREIIHRYFPGSPIQFQNILFISPLAAEKNEEKEVQIIVSCKKSKNFDFEILSKDGDSWQKHVTGKIVICAGTDRQINLQQLKEDCWVRDLVEFPYADGNDIVLGERWNCVKKVKRNDENILAEMSLPEKFSDDLTDYKLHPALLDEAVNVAIRSIDTFLYLPFSYRKFSMYKSLPMKFYCYIKKMDVVANKEFVSFDMDLLDADGNVIAEIEDYKVKKVSNKSFLTDNLFTHKIDWTDAEPLNKDNKFSKNEKIAVIAGTSEAAKKIIAALKIEYSGIVTVNLGDELKFDDLKSIGIRADNYDDYCKLIEYLSEQKIGTIIDLAGVRKPCGDDDMESVRKEAAFGIYSLFLLYKAISQTSFRCRLVIAAQYAFKCLEGDNVKALNTALLSFGQAMTADNANITVKCLDFGNNPDIHMIVNEITDKKMGDIISLRGDKRLVRQLVPVDYKSYVRSEKQIIKDGGVYIITGGLGGIGLEIAMRLSLMANVKIILLSRRTFPCERQWDNYDIKSDEYGKIVKLKKIKSNGSEVFIYSADISDKSKMSAVINETVNKIGPVNGVFHCAGVAGDKLLQLKTLEQFENVIKPKIFGTLVLNDLLKNLSIDFLMIFSSVSSFLVSQGQSDYAAANAFMDGYSYSSDLPVKIINWSAWKETGMAADYNVDFNNEIFKPVLTDNGMKLIDYVLNSRLNHVIIGAVNDLSVIKNTDKLMLKLPEEAQDNKLNFFAGSKSAEDDVQKPNEYSSVELSGKESDAQYTEMEKALATAIGHILQMDKININKGFIELGGNSILAVRVQLELEAAGLPISITDLYNYSSISAIAENIEEKTDKKPDKPLVPITDSIIFNDIFYKTCFHNSLFTALNILNIDMECFYRNDHFMYWLSDNKDSLENGVKDTTDYSLLQLLKYSNVNCQMFTHLLSESPADLVIGKNEKKLLDKTKQYIGKTDKSLRKRRELFSYDLDTALSKQHLVIVWVDCYYEKLRNDTYLKKHWPHTILICGQDKQKKEYVITEQSTVDALDYKIRNISKDEIKRCYYGFIENYSAAFDYPTFYELSVKKPADKQVKLVFGSGIDSKMNVESLIKISDNIKHAVASSETLANENGDIIELLNCIINFKKVQRYSILKVDPDASSGEILNTIISHWQLIRDKILKSVYGRYSAELLDDVIKQLNEIVKREYEFMEAETKRQILLD